MQLAFSYSTVCGCELLHYIDSGLTAAVVLCRQSDKGPGWCQHGERSWSGHISWLGVSYGAAASSYSKCLWSRRCGGVWVHILGEARQWVCRQTELDWRQYTVMYMPQVTVVTCMIALLSPSVDSLCVCVCLHSCSCKVKLVQECGVARLWEVTRCSFLLLCS